MNFKPLGQTAVLLPEIGLGTWGYHGGVEPLRAGLAAGAFIDTAESYGTEEVIGRIVAGRREKAFIASKVSKRHLRFEEVLRAAEASLRRLGVDYIDLYQIHEPNPAVPVEETVAAMERLVDEGKVKFIGVSNFNVKQLEAARRAARKHGIVSNQVRYSLIDRTIETELLPYCNSHQITVIAYSPLGREMQRIHDGDPGGVLNGIARETGKTLPQIVLNWCLCHAGVVAIPKGNSVAHVVENCGSSGWRLTEEQRQRLADGIRFRRRSPAEQAFRKLLPGSAAPLIRRCLRLLPPAVRRRMT